MMQTRFQQISHLEPIYAFHLEERPFKPACSKSAQANTTLADECGLNLYYSWYKFTVPV